MTETADKLRLDLQRRLLSARLAAASQAQPAETSDHPDVVAGDGTRMVFNPTTGQYTNADMMANSMAPGVGQSALAGVVNGGSFGWFDEFAGKVSGDPMMAEVARAKQIAAERDHPIVTTGASIAGNMLSLAPAGGVLGAGASMGAKAAVGAATGAAMGAAQGAGDANNGDRMQGGAMGAAIGGTLGAAAPFVGKAVGYAYQNWFKGSDVSGIATALGVSKSAAKIIKTFVSQDNPAEAARLLARAGDKAMLADAGPASSQLLDTAVSGGGASMGIAKDAVEGRAAAAMQLLNGVMDKVLGPVDGMKALASGVASRTSAVRKAAYDAAYNSAIDYAAPEGAAIEDVLARIPNKTFAAAIAEANDAMKAEGIANKQIMAIIGQDGKVAFQEMPNVQQLDFIKRALGTVSEGERDSFGRLTGPGVRAAKLAGDLRDAIGAAVPRYSLAVKLGGDKIAEDKALALGSKLLSPTVTREEVWQQMAGASKEAMQAARKGLRSAIDEGLAQIQAVMSNPNTEAREAAAAIKKLSSRANVEKVTAILGQRAAKDLMDTLDTAETQLALKAAIATNSKTAVRQAGQDAMNSIINGGPIEAFARGDVGQATKGIVAMLTNRTPEALTAKQQAIYAEVAKALTQIRGSSAQAALAIVQRAIAGQPATEAQARLVAALTAAAFGPTGYRVGQPMLAPGTGAPAQP